jgi:flagellar motor switch protein FliN/FliY
MNALDDHTTEIPPEPSAATAGAAAEMDLTADAAAASTLPSSILQIPVEVQVVLGTARLPIGKVAELRTGSSVTLDQKLGAPVAILVNGKEVAKGELFVLDGETDRLGVTITELAPKAGTS